MLGLGDFKDTRPKEQNRKRVNACQAQNDKTPYKSIWLVLYFNSLIYIWKN